ncbi:Rho termination factor N-terminal domain-containing protein, partial [Kitasatospora sp. P5_F3]
MSDSTDLMGARPDADASDTAAPAAPAKRRRTAAAGLDGLVLAELQKLASTLGISGTGRLRKSQLIDAIKEKSGGDPLLAGAAAPAAPAKRATKAAAPAAAEAPAAEAPVAEDLGDVAAPPRAARRTKAAAAAAAPAAEPQAQIEIPVQAAAETAAPARA